MVFNPANSRAGESEAAMQNPTRQRTTAVVDVRDSRDGLRIMRKRGVGWA